MPSVDWIYIVVVVAIGLFGDMIILSVRRQHREEQRLREMEEERPVAPVGELHR